MNLKTVTIADLEPHPQNPNTHPVKQIDALGDSLDEFDQAGANQMRPGNLLTLKIIKCLACYDFGEIIDPFDQAKRTPCACQPARQTHWLCPCLSQGELSWDNLTEDDKPPGWDITVKEIREYTKAIFEKHQSDGF
ncbi:hypothetical protein LCGC14_0937460 [marine sediment metagenome]|uniref:Uncharacterized protein n=2 Tax=marine sediment metagenome TaxID=412755 RepID=A0A0F9FRQ3_9ZZZZ